MQHLDLLQFLGLAANFLLVYFVISLAFFIGAAKLDAVKAIDPTRRDTQTLYQACRSLALSTMLSAMVLVLVLWPMVFSNPLQAELYPVVVLLLGVGRGLTAKETVVKKINSFKLSVTNQTR